jgi:catechol 2,3-dioxygenase-like lactoylglutathione lyase family enzyme
MKPRIKVITLAVSDLERSLAFYRDGMGLPTKGIIGQEFEDGAVVFVNMNDDLIFALFPEVSYWLRWLKAAALKPDVGLLAKASLPSKTPRKPMQGLGAMTPAVAAWNLDELPRERIEVA